MFQFTFININTPKKKGTFFPVTHFKDSKYNNFNWRLQWIANMYQICRKQWKSSTTRIDFLLNRNLNILFLQFVMLSLNCSREWWMADAYTYFYLSMPSSSVTREVNASERKFYFLHCAWPNFFFVKTGKEHWYVSYREMMSAYRMMTFCRDRGFILLTCARIACSPSDILHIRIYTACLGTRALSLKY